jgi:hypothetical protein
MPFDADVVSATITDELQRIGLLSPTVIASAPDDHRVVVTVTSPSFEGQTYLDRELRVRPAVLRAIAANGLTRVNVIIDVLTPEEANGSPVHNERVLAATDSSDSTEDRIGRSRWLVEVESVLQALRDSSYSLHPISDARLYVATRDILTREAVLVAFAQSPKASTVDLETRNLIDDVRLSQKIGKAYYIVPKILDAPFANQRPATWLQILTHRSFLHALNSSDTVAKNLLAECEVLVKGSLQELAGPVVEPDVVIGSDGLECGAFGYFSNWVAEPDCSFLLLMAPGGHGKTTFATELTRRLCINFLTDPSKPIPLLVGFEAVRRTVDFEALLHKRLANLHGGGYGAFRELLRHNAAILIVDGFDELAEDAGVGVAEAQVRNMRPLLQGKAKVVLAGRTAFADQFSFGRPMKDRMAALLGDVRSETAEILAFSTEQVHEYISTRSGMTAEQRMAAEKFADANPDNTDLCSNPLLLAFVCSLAASNGLHALGATEGAGIDSVLDRVCLREETRQHLGLGISGQLEFLKWVASEAFKNALRTGSSTVTTEDVQFIAATVAETNHVEPEVVGRLATHAFLTGAPRGRLTFIHPLVRDIVIGRQLVGTGPTDPILDVGDIPEGAARHVALRLATDAEAYARYFPVGWLANASIRSQSRRNMFRIAALTPRFRTKGNPRKWANEAWSASSRVNKLDASGLYLSALSFSDLVFYQCDFEGAFFEDCDLFGVSFIECNLMRSVFAGCRRDYRLLFEKCEDVIDVLLSTDGGPYSVVNDEDELRVRLVPPAPPQVPDEPYPVVPDDDVIAYVRDLLVRVLAHLVDVEPGGVRFFRISVDHLLTRSRRGLDDTERKTLDGEVLPCVVSQMGAQSMGGSSVRNVEIAKHWRPSVVELLRDGRMTPRMTELLGGLAARAARYTE